MSPKLLRLIPLAIVAAFVGGLWTLTDYYGHLPQRLPQHETIVLGQDQFVPGSQAALRVVTSDNRDGSPLPNAAITVSLQSAAGGELRPLYTGVADNAGIANVAFTVPADIDPEQTLVIETSSSLGADYLTRTVTVARDYRILLTTDKPIYQPGQIIHMRALALGTFDLTPAAGQSLEIIVADGKGNKVFRETLTTSDYGVAFTDFQLASEVNIGNYKITAMLGNTSSEKTVPVERYVLPRFAVNVTTERPYYAPGEHVRGTLDADYFFGKPVAGSEVLLEGYTFDVERAVTFNLQGLTDEAGNFTFEFDLPGYVAGSDLDSGLGRFYVQATVRDQAGHSETSNVSFPVAQSQLVIEAIPESGQFRPGVENILYVLVSALDGTPTPATLTLTFEGQTLAAETDPYGLAELRVTPRSPYQNFILHAQSLTGATATREFQLQGEWQQESLLLRPDRPAYRVGEAMTLSLFTSQSNGTVYLDIVREGQTVSTRAVPVSTGYAEVVVDLTPDLYGTLELHAYKILSGGQMTRDTRLAVVDAPTGLNVALTPDRDIYRPGDTAGLTIQITGADSLGAQSAIGLAIVDESVFALTEQDPGFARLYFLLEEELQRPKYDLHGYTIGDVATQAPIGDEVLRTAQENAARAALAEAASKKVAFSLQANSRLDALLRAQQRQETYFTALVKNAYPMTLGLPIAIFGLSAIAAWREKRFWSSLGLGVLITVALPFALFFLAIATMGIGALVGLVALIGLIGLGWLSLVVIAWRRGSWLRGLVVMLIPLYAFVVFLFIYALGYSSFFFVREQQSWLMLFGLILVVVAFFMQLGSASLSHLFPSTTITTLLLLTVMASLLLSACSPAMRPTLFDAQATSVPSPSNEASDSSGDDEEPHLRQYFPETLLWLPDAMTDENGYLHFEFPVADSITTWRMTALASTRDGRLGSAIANLSVFQEFFIEPDLPSALTVGDEVAVPVGVFNYLPEPQTVRLSVEPAAWFDLLDEAEKEISIGANEVGVAYFRLRANAHGLQTFKVTALGAQLSDAVQKTVRVFPNGKELSFTHSDRLTPGTSITQTITLPAEAIAGTQSLTVKIYPGIASQVVEGLDSILRMPYGCFEQTSSTTYPNILVLDYLRTTNQASPETQFKAEEYINLGYQRLTTFEVGGSGGFSLFGNPPPDRMLTAYGLQEFADMSRVHDVDPALVQRAAEWLFSQQQSDGTWANDDGLHHESTWRNLDDARLPVTAYVTWSLIDAGFGEDARTQKALAYIRQKQALENDPYVVALVANALVAADSKAGDMSADTEAVLDRLAGLAQRDGNTALWASGVATFVGSQGQTGSIETTALAALALLRAQRQPEVANAALTALVQQKDSFGTWHSTQATVLSLKALIQSVRAGSELTDAEVTVRLNGGQARTVRLSHENFDVVQLLTFNEIQPGQTNTIEIYATGEGNLMYQVAGRYYVPWSAIPQPADDAEPMTIDVAYDRTQLSVNDSVAVNVSVALTTPGSRADSALIDLGLPPGFSVRTEDLDALIAQYSDVPSDYALPTIERYELTERQILVYLRNVSYDSPVHFSYRLTAKYPLTAQAPASLVYDYYNPDIADEAAPQVLTVTP